VTGTATSGTPTVQLVAVTGSATLAAGAAIGVPVASGSQWTFNRGVTLGQPGGAQFRAVLAGTQSDDDFIEIPEQGQGTVYLASRARVLTTTDTTVTARLAVADPYPQGSNTVTVAYQNLGAPAVTPASGGTLTPAATLTEAAGTFIDYVITRPPFGSGTARVTYTATASGRVSDSDAVDVPAVERDTTYLTGRARVISTNNTQVIVRYAVIDKYTALSCAMSYTTVGVPSVSPGTPQSVTAAVADAFPTPPTAEAAGSYVDFTIQRPAFEAGNGGVTFQVSNASRVSATAFVVVPAVERDTITLTARARTTSTTNTTQIVRVAVADPVPGAAATIAFTTTNLATPTQVGGAPLPGTITVTPAATLTEAAGTYYDFEITRPAAAQPSGRINFTVTAPSRAPAAPAATVVAQDIIGPSLQVVTTPSANTYSLVITYIGTITYALDGIAQSTAGFVSPHTLVITRNDYLGATQLVALAVTRDGSTVSETINVPPKDNANATITIGTQSADDVTNIYTFTFSTSGMPTGTTFDLTYTTTTTAGVVEQGTLNNQTSPINVSSGYAIGSNPKYQMTVTAIKSGTLVLVKSRSGTFLT
jgi:hypothetical protein